MPESMLSQQSTSSHTRDALLNKPRKSEGKAFVVQNNLGNPELAKLLINKAHDIKMLSEVAVKAIAIADNPQSKIQNLVSVVGQDLKLTTNILSLANSPLFPTYSAGDSASCLKLAITRLGFRQTKQMILASCYSSTIRKLSFNEKDARKNFTKHSILTGCICTELNKLFGLGIQGEEFTAGLIHDIGRLLLLAAMPDQFLTVDKVDFREQGSLLKQEMDVFGTTHTEVGEWFLRKNQIPEELVSVAKHHHFPAASQKYTRLVALVAVADHMASSCSENMVAPEEYEYPTLDNLQLLEMLGATDAAQILDKDWSGVFIRAIETCEQILNF